MEISEAIHALGRQGYAVVDGVGASAEALLDLVGRVAVPRTGTFWGTLQDVRFDPQADGRSSISATARPMAPHTDGSFEPVAPRYLFLQCVRPDRAGFGDSTVSDIRAVVPDLSGPARSALAEPSFVFRRRSDGKTATAMSAVLGGTATGAATVRYRHDELYSIVARTATGASAVEELSRLLRRGRHTVRVPLAPGDVLWLDNHRALHGRTPLSGTAIRRLRTAWADAPAHEEAV